MKKEIKWVFPKKLTLRQYAEWLHFCKENQETDDIIKVHIKAVSIATSKPMREVEAVALVDLPKLAKEAMSRFTIRREEGEPKEYITLQGLTFRLETDVKKITSGQVADTRSKEEAISMQPDYFLAVLYTPVNHEMDRATRQRFFNEHFPVNEWLNVSGFFLQEFEALKILSSVLNTMRAKEITAMVSKHRHGTNGSLYSSRWRKFWESLWTNLRLSLTQLYLAGRNIYTKKQNTKEKQ